MSIYAHQDLIKDCTGSTSALWCSSFLFKIDGEKYSPYKAAPDVAFSWMPCTFTEVPDAMLTRIENGQYNTFNLVASNRKAPPYAPTKRIEHVGLLVPAAQKTSNEDIAALLDKCSVVIGELSESLEDAQVRGEPLKHYTLNSYHRAAKAKAQLLEAGLIESVGRATWLTPKGMEARIGTHVRGTETGQQLVRYTPEVLNYINVCNKEKPKLTPEDKVLINPNGERVAFENVVAFAKENDLTSPKIYQVLAGSRKSHKGWTKA